MRTKDNSILAEFEFLVDLDLALFKYIRINFYNTDFVNKSILHISDESKIIETMLYRKEQNPLDILFNDDISTEKLYNELINVPDNYSKVLDYARAYDTFPLLITLLNNASSIEVTILCRNSMEEQFIHNLNPKIPTIISSNKSDVNLTDYTVLWIKYFIDAIQYRNIKGKHIYIAAAKFNMEPDRDIPNIQLSGLFSDINIVHLMDLYRKVKYRYSVSDDIIESDEFEEETVDEDTI